MTQDAFIVAQLTVAAAIQQGKRAARIARNVRYHAHEGHSNRAEQYATVRFVR